MGSSKRQRVYVLATTDLHSNALNYDYYRDRVVDQFGLAKIATLIREVRQRGEPVFLFDNGDLIQGTPLAETRVLQYKSGDHSGLHPMIQLMNHLRYDAATVGNHEFNYGLDYLRWVLGGAEFVYLNSNILNVSDRVGLQSFLPPYAVIEKETGSIPISLGVVGFVPPQIMQWDKAHLEGKVKALDIQVAAKMFVPQVRKRNVHGLVALSHSGLVIEPPGAVNENSSYALTKMPGVDVIVAGHTHDLFPDQEFEIFSDQGVDVEKGVIGGKAVMMPGFWGSHLGISTLDFELEDGRWELAERSAEVVSTKGVPECSDIMELIQTEHVQTQKRMRSPVGHTESRLHTYFARVADSEAIQLTNQAHIWYAKRLIAETEFADYPMLAVSPPFRAGFAGLHDYTDIQEGRVAMQHIADLYVYPNSFACVLLDGGQIRLWIERAAENFNQIDPLAEDEQFLINDAFPTYNFDIFEGIEYVLDITRPAGQRLVELTRQGRPIDSTEQFLIVTNSYRANGGGRFPGLDGTSIIYEAPEVSAEVLMAYIRHQGKLKITADENWRIRPFACRGPVRFRSPRKGLGLEPVWLKPEQDDGKSEYISYRVDFP